MSVEITQPHQCQHLSCKCNIDQTEPFCSAFCKDDVEPSEDDRRCGCGHAGCDVTKELGNVSTFEATGS